ncbi:MAG: hypothetical protein ABH830_00300, partial [Patescibacteria group bacterium]
MNVFLIDFVSPIMIEVAKELKNKVEILYWTGQKKDFEKIKQEKEQFPNTIFHNSLDAAKGIGAREINVDTFNPPGADLITEMLECESLTLTMMTRLDYKNISLLKKKHLYYKYLQYWDGVINKLKPDVIIMRSV